MIYIEKSLGDDIDAVVKVHPTCSKNDILKLVPELSSKNISFSNKSIPELLKLTSVVISSASSVCIEAIALGIPVAMLGSRSGVTMNPVPVGVSKKVCTVFFKPKDLKLHIIYALDRKTRIREVEKWFFKVGKRNTRELFLKY